jgi:hydroxymethylpyrimidine pyrophosphatase-like HAD family hydrolase
MTCPIYIDIDGTLTNDGDKACAPVVPSRLTRVRKMITAGIPIVIWSATGTSYAKKFCKDYALEGENVTAIGKPKFCVDDCKTIRPNLLVRPPTWLK